MVKSRICIYTWAHKTPVWLSREDFHSWKSLNIKQIFRRVDNLLPFTQLRIFVRVRSLTQNESHMLKISQMVNCKIQKKITYKQETHTCVDARNFQKLRHRSNKRREKKRERLNVSFSVILNLDIIIRFSICIKSYYDFSWHVCEEQKKVKLQFMFLQYSKISNLIKDPLIFKCSHQKAKIIIWKKEELLDIESYFRNEETFVLESLFMWI